MRAVELRQFKEFVLAVSILAVMSCGILYLRAPAKKSVVGYTMTHGKARLYLVFQLIDFADKECPQRENSCVGSWIKTAMPRYVANASGYTDADRKELGLDVLHITSREFTKSGYFLRTELDLI